MPELKDTDLKGCIYNRYKNPYCPIFRLGDIVSEAKENFGDMAVEVKPYFYNLSKKRCLMFLYITYMTFIYSAGNICLIGRCGWNTDQLGL